MTLEEVASAARELSADDREILLYALTEELTPAEQERIDRLWSEEITNRHRARLEGRSQAYELTEVIAEIRKRIDAAP